MRTRWLDCTFESTGRHVCTLKTPLLEKPFHRRQLTLKALGDLRSLFLFTLHQLERLSCSHAAHAELLHEPGIAHVVRVNRAFTYS
jgi:hypothetical protein